VIRVGPARLADGAVALREIAPDDAADLYRWRMQPRVQPLFHSSREVPWEEHAAFVARYFEPGNDDAWFVIEVNGQPAGAVALYRSGPGDNSWEAGRIVFAPERRGLGAFRLARRAIALLMAHARAAGHGRMRCEVLEENRVMRAIVDSLGFVEIGSGERHGRRYRELAAALQETA
jgi:RimJ/RimL family protein N-acetyltransferase